VENKKTRACLNKSGKEKMKNQPVFAPENKTYVSALEKIGVIFQQKIALDYRSD